MEKTSGAGSEARRRCPKRAAGSCASARSSQPLLPSASLYSPPRFTARTGDSARLPAEHPSPQPTCKFISALGQNPSCSLRKKAQAGTRWVAGSSVFLFSLGLQQHRHLRLLRIIESSLAVSQAFLTWNSFPSFSILRFQLLSIFLILHVLDRQCSQLGHLYTGAEELVYKETTQLGGSTEGSSPFYQAVKQNQAKRHLLHHQIKS